MGFLSRCIQALNQINTNLYAFTALMLAVLLCVKHIQVGDQLLVGAFALLHSTGTTTNNVDVKKAEVKVAE
jgi:hypothetical protein